MHKLATSLAVLLSVFLCNISAYANNAGPSKEMVKYFEGTDYELDVYIIKGRKAGKTMFILGGIQGDEPGGYLSADLYADLQLEKGNIIVIPRGNLKSVILFDRGPEGDMNRLFVEKPEKDSLDQQVVGIIIKYMQQSDIFLNLHDGWGFYSDTYVNERRNPKRFGQSVIVDEDIYVCNDNKSIDLKSLALKALEETNSKIDNKDHHLAYFNTNTGNPDGQYKSMQKTATWYALRKFCIPAFGIEASKNLKSLDDKVLYHNYAINAFMKQMDIVPEIPPLMIISPKLSDATLLVDGVSITATEGSAINIKHGAKVQIIDINSNYDRGITCDVTSYGNYNDFNKEITITHDTQIKFRKEDKVFGNINIKIIPRPELPVVENTLPGYHIMVSVNGKDINVSDGASFNVNKGDTVIIKKFASGNRTINLPVNLRGWVPDTEENNTADDRMYEIKVDDQNMIKRFSVNAEGKSYPLTINNIYNKEIARMFMVIN